MSIKKVTRDEVKAFVDQNASKLPENAIIIAAARKIKNGQVELEFVQNRTLGGRTTSILSLLNAGDSRFASSGTTMRVWLMVDPKNLKEVFPASFSDEDVKLISDLVSKMDERDSKNAISIFRVANVVRDRGVDYTPRIIAIETTDVDELPKSIREIMNDPNQPQEYKNRYILQTGGENSEEIVSEDGKRVYRRYELVFGRDLNDSRLQDRMLEGKMLNSEFVKRNSQTHSGLQKQVDKVLEDFTV